MLSASFNILSSLAIFFTLFLITTVTSTFFFFFFNDPAPTEIYPLSLHDALPIFVSYLQNVQTHVKIFDPGGKPLGEIAFPGIGALGGLGGDWDRPETFYSFSTLAHPTTIYRYDVATGKQEVWAKLAVPVSDQAVEIRQVWYPSKDGTKIPMFIAHRRGVQLGGTNPTPLTGYGRVPPGPGPRPPP